MEDLLAVVYLICFALIAGGAFALMTQSLRRPERPVAGPAISPPLSLHPEAPQVGEEVLYVDLSRERLEELYRQAS